MGVFLVTGGAGFIGSHLVDKLAAEGHSVRVLDNLSSGRRNNLPRGVEVIEADVLDAMAVRRCFDGVDGCFHLAAIASVAESHRNWRRAHQVNATGTVTVFEEAFRSQEQLGHPMPVVYASSAAVYGDSAAVPNSEDARPNPCSAYAADKLASEFHASVASRIYGVPTVGLRFFNVYGPRQDPRSRYSGVVAIFCERLLQSTDVEIHGDGEQIRDFVYVDDAVAALCQAISAAKTTPAVFNVCTGHGTTIRRLGETIARCCGTPFAPHRRPSRSGDLRISTGDPRLARKNLGFVATTTLENGIAQTLEAERIRLRSSLPPAVPDGGSMVPASPSAW